MVKHEIKAARDLRSLIANWLVNFVSLTGLALLHPVPINIPANIAIIIYSLHNSSISTLYI